MYQSHLYMYQSMASVRTWNQTDDLCQTFVWVCRLCGRDLMGGLNINRCDLLWVVDNFLNVTLQYCQL
jgi:hypothetical protein